MKKINKLILLVFLTLFSKIVLADCPTANLVTYDSATQHYQAKDNNGVIWTSMSPFSQNYSEFDFVGASADSANGNETVSSIYCVYFSPKNIVSLIALIPPQGTIYNVLASKGKWKYSSTNGIYQCKDWYAHLEPTDCPFIPG